MNQAQAARQTQEAEPAANVEVESGSERFEPGRSSTRVELEEAEFEQDEDEDEDEDIGQMAVRVLTRARRRIRQQPLTAATGAFILGFAVGNGIPKFLARAGVAIGLRMVMQRMFDRPEMFEADA